MNVLDIGMKREIISVNRNEQRRKFMEEKEIQRMCKKHNRILWRTILGVITLLVGLAGVVYAGVMQMILCYQKFGVIISSEDLIIPHLS